MKKRCPKCGMGHDKAVLSCDCGHKFIEAEKRTVREEWEKNMVLGALWCIGGIVITVVTRLAAEEQGGLYIIAWGPAVYGGIRFLQGLLQFIASRSSGTSPHQEPQAE